MNERLRRTALIATRDRLQRELSSVSVRNQVLVINAGDGLLVARPPANGLVPVRHAALTAIEIGFEFQVVDSADRNEWAIAPTKYAYSLLGPGDQELLAFHWHPDVPGRPDPHLHLGPASQAVGLLRESHVPTGMIALADVLRYTISELGVEPLRRDWDAVLQG